jgi:6-phosphofructokinase 1
VYIPEEGISMDMLSSDIGFLRAAFAKDRGAGRAGKIILRNEYASNTYSTQMIAEMITEEAKGRFDSRSAIPGNFQQGDRPSPIDRVRGLRMAIRCVEYVEQYARKSKDDIAKDEQTAVVMGIEGSEVLFCPLGGPEGLEAVDTDWVNAKRKNENWLEMKDMVDMLSGRPKMGK